MNTEQKEIFRKAILQLLYVNNTRWGLGILWLINRLPEKGFSKRDFDNDDKKFYDAIADELQYLTDKKLLEKVLKIVSKENEVWRMTRDGIAFVDANC